jgi:hypothetical protein
MRVPPTLGVSVEERIDERPHDIESFIERARFLKQ